VFNDTDKIQDYRSVQKKPRLTEHNIRDEQKKVYEISQGYAFALVARAVTGFDFEAGFAFVFEAGALAVALVALTAAVLAAGYREGLASAVKSRQTLSLPSWPRLFCLKPSLASSQRLSS
jgi:hypothetical protein